jgi:hypothetical protein
MYYRRMHELVQPKISEREKERKKKSFLVKGSFEK